MKQLDIFDDLPLPKSNTQEVLFTLIQQGEVSIMDFPYLSGFRTRVSELQNSHNLKLSKKMILKKNKFGNVFQYAKHILNDNNKQRAVELYKKLINN